MRVQRPHGGAAELERVLVQLQRGADVAGEPVGDREVIGRPQRASVAFTVKLGPGRVDRLIHIQRLAVIPQRPQVGRQATGRHQGMRVVGAEQLTLLGKYLLVQRPRLLEAGLVAQDNGQVEAQMKQLPADRLGQRRLGS